MACRYARGKRGKGSTSRHKSIRPGVVCCSRTEHSGDGVLHVRGNLEISCGFVMDIKDIQLELKLRRKGSEDLL